MISIIENPNPTKIFEGTCDKCQCRFQFNISDVYEMTSIFGGGGFMPHVVKCPNCGKEILVK